jgi:hypothetical protein
MQFTIIKKVYKTIRRALFGRFILNRLWHRRFIRMLNHYRANPDFAKAVVSKDDNENDYLDGDRVATGISGRLIHFKARK